MACVKAKEERLFGRGLVVGMAGGVAPGQKKGRPVWAAFLSKCALAVFAVLRVPVIGCYGRFLVVLVVVEDLAMFGAPVVHRVDLVNVIPCAEAVITCHPEFHSCRPFRACALSVRLIVACWRLPVN